MCKKRKCYSTAMLRNTQRGTCHVLHVSLRRLVDTSGGEFAIVAFSAGGVGGGEGKPVYMDQGKIEEGGGVVHPPRPSSSLSVLFSSGVSEVLDPAALMMRPLVLKREPGFGRSSASLARLTLCSGWRCRVMRSSLRISRRYDSIDSTKRLVCRCLELAHIDIESSLMM